MEAISSLFRPDNNVFTIFVVEQRFAVGRGYDFFRSYLNTPNYFDSDAAIQQSFQAVIDHIGKSVTPIAKLMSFFTNSTKLATITDIVTSLCQLFTVHEHQAAGPEIIDPIIIQEGKISKRALTKLIYLNKESILNPSVIIILKDNNFERARQLLSDCPHGINVKMIRNSGEIEIIKIINCGTDDINSFITAYSDQCFSSCSNTRKEVLLNSQWTDNRIVSDYSPLLFKLRANLLGDRKIECIGDLSEILSALTLRHPIDPKDAVILQSIECIARLFRVFCNDTGGEDIIIAQKIAKELDNEILQAHVYRYAEFLPNCSRTEREELYDKGIATFRRHKMEDHAIYCLNNKLIEQFYTDDVVSTDFSRLQTEAVNNVPGLVGLSHIYNNTAISYLYCGQPSRAIEGFTHGLDYARYQDRLVQNLALETNRIIAECYSYTTVEDVRLYTLMRKLFDGLGIERLPFLSADYALNILSVAFLQDENTGRELLHSFPVGELIDRSFSTNPMGSGGRKLQMKQLSSRYSDLSNVFNQCNIPEQTDIIDGKKASFIKKYGLCPVEFNTWL